MATINPVSPTPSPDKPARRRINTKGLVITVLTVAGLGVGAHFLHGFQVQRNAHALVQQADRAEAAGDVLKAAAYLGRYLGFAPRDPEVRCRYALLLEKAAKTPARQEQAFLALEGAVRLAPEREDVRRQAVKLAMQMHYFSDARGHLETLHVAHPKDGDLEYQLGQAEEGNSRFEKAAEWYGKAVEHKPDLVAAYLAHASLLRRRLDQEALADEVIATMMKNTANSQQALLARTRYLAEFKIGTSLDDARQDLASVLDDLGRDNPDVFLLAGDLELAHKDRKKAREYLERGRELHGKDIRYYQALARLDLQEGSRAQALEHLREGMKYLDDQGGAVWDMLNLFINAGETNEAQSLLEGLNPATLPPGLRDYLQARMDMQEKKWAKAIGLLQQCRQSIAALPHILKLACLQLAECYRQVGNPDQQMVACQAALDADPSWVPAQLAFAQAALNLGRADGALTRYESLVSREPEARLSAVRLHIQRNLRLPPEQRRWDRATELLKEAPQSFQQTVEYRLVGADLLAAQNQLEKAAEQVDTIRKEAPSEPRVWLAAINLALRQKHFEKARALLDEAERVLGASVDLTVTRLGYLRTIGKTEEAQKLLKAVETKVDALPASEQAPWLRFLAGDALDEGASDAAEKWLRRLAQAQPNALDARVLLFDLALIRADKSRLREITAELRKLEGEEGVLWRYAEAMRILNETPSPDAQVVARARGLLAEAGKRRGSWGRILLAQGRIEEVAGNREGAIAKYQAALQLGERQADMIGRLVVLLNGIGRSRDAQEVIRKMQEAAPQSPLLDRLAVESSLLNKDNRKHTVEQARKAVSPDSTNYRDHLWLGQVLSALGEPAEGEAALRKALKLAPEKPEPVVSLVQVLVATKRHKDAEEILSRAQGKLPAGDRALTLATCYEALGQLERAEEQYRKLLADRPDDAGLLRLIAQLYLVQGQLAKAETLLRQIVRTRAAGTEGNVVWARRTLALTLASQGSYARVREALALVEENLFSPYASPADERLKALLLAVKPGGRRQAIRTLEASFQRQPPSPEEQLLLARLYEANHDWPRAAEQLLALVTQDPQNPTYLASYVRGLLQNKKEEEAGFWLEKLEALEPKGLRAVALRAELLHAEKHDAEAIKLLRDFAAADARDRGRQLSVARLLDNLGHPDKAEALYRSYARSRDDHPEDTLPLVLNLARQNRVGDALDLCQDLRGKLPPETLAEVSVNVLRSARPSRAECGRVEGWLKEDLGHNLGSAVLALGIANVRDLQGREADAEALYREILNQAPGNIIARNNLAMFLAVQPGKGAEALSHVQRALDEAGPQPFLLDTRGLVYLGLGQLDQAIADLEEAATSGTDAASYYRLARAYHLNKNRTAAASAFRKAYEAGFKPEQLHPLEREAFQQIAKEYPEQ